MASDMEKMLRLLTEQAELELPEDPDGESSLLDAGGRVCLRFGISVHRDIIRSAGYWAAPEAGTAVSAALAAAAVLARDRAIMSASLIRPADIAARLSDDGSVNDCDREAVSFAALMLRECLRNYSMRYNERRAERLRARGELKAAEQGPSD